MTAKLVITACAAAVVGLTTLSGAALAQQKTAKECNAEWTAQKADLKAKGTKKKDFMAECQGTAMPAAAAPAAEPTPARPMAGRPASTPKPAAENEFASEAQAKAHCASDTVVWVNLRSRVYHYADSAKYGKTKKGAYMCEKETAGAGYRPSKTEKKS